MAEEKIAVIGAGPVGGILSAHLLTAGLDVTIIDIYEPHLDKIRKDGLVIEGVKNLHAQAPKSFISTKQAAEQGHRFDYVYVCVKATVVKFIANDIPSVLTDQGVAISFQNGLDTEQGLLDVLGPEKTLRGAVNYAGNLLGLGRIKMTFFNPPNHLGASVKSSSNTAQKAKDLAALMTKADLQTSFSDDIQYHVWEKAVRNAGLMPVSALTGQNMAQVMESARSVHLVENLLTEEIEIAKAAGYEFPEGFYEETLEYYKKAGTHVPSMRGDVVDGRQTEIEFLNHRIAEYGEKHNVPCPYNRAIANLLLCVDEVAVLNKKSKTNQEDKK